jgi:AcrR family transcriptional regulator
MGMRERKRLQLKSELERTGLRLFVERGFDNVTVADIAASVDVSLATFYRYFNSKEALLVADGEEVMAQFRERLETRPRNESLLHSTIESLRTLFSEIDEDEELFTARHLIGARTPSVQGYIFSFEQKILEVAAEALADRIGGVKDARRKAYLLVSCAMTAARVLRAESIRAGTELLIDDLFDQLESSLKDLGELLGERNV